MPVRDLSIAHQQFVEIIRGLNAEAKVLLLDEPTAALPERERDIVLETMRRLRDRGMAIVLVTHALDEVLDVSDVITVMRGGATVGSAPASEWEKRSLVEAMSGEYQEFTAEHGVASSAKPYVRVQNLTVPGSIGGVDLEVRPGEIVGLAGLVGSGRTTIMRCLAGAEPRARGELEIDGVTRRWPHSVRRSLGYGIALLPEDRKAQGLHLSRSILDNLTLMNLAAVSDGPVIRVGRQRAALASLATHISLPAYPPHQAVGQLSGGNQQKVLLGKVLHARPRLLLADEPVRGVDVSAKVDIMTALRDLAGEGTAIIMTSSEIEDVLDIADTVLVVADGRIAAKVDTRDRSVSVNDVLSIVFDSLNELGSTIAPEEGQHS